MKNLSEMQTADQPELNYGDLHRGTLTKVSRLIRRSKQHTRRLLMAEPKDERVWKIARRIEARIAARVTQ